MKEVGGTDQLTAIGIVIVLAVVLILVLILVIILIFILVFVVHNLILQIYCFGFPYGSVPWFL